MKIINQVVRVSSTANSTKMISYLMRGIPLVMTRITTV